MMSRIYSACPLGVKAVPIIVEVDVRNTNKQMCKVSIVGLPDTATRESKDRLVPAITNSGYALDSDEIIINLSPADLRKEGTAYDLSMAVGILAARGIIKPESLEGTLILGELALDGTVRPVRSVLASAECARENNLHTLIVPRANGSEASLVKGLTIYEVESLASLIHFFRGKRKLEAYEPTTIEAADSLPDLPDLRDVKGHAAVKRVLEIAAAGQHNLLILCYN